MAKNDSPGVVGAAKQIVAVLMVIAGAVAGAMYVIKLTIEVLRNRKRWLIPQLILVWLVIGVPCFFVLGMILLCIMGLFGYCLIMPYHATVSLWSSGKPLTGLIFVPVGILLDLAVLGAVYEAIRKNYPDKTNKQNFTAALAGLAVCALVSVILLLVQGYNERIDHAKWEREFSGCRTSNTETSGTSGTSSSTRPWSSLQGSCERGIPPTRSTTWRHTPSSHRPRSRTLPNGMRMLTG